MQCCIVSAVYGGASLKIKHFVATLQCNVKNLYLYFRLWK